MGRKHTPETKEKIRLSKLGRKLSPAHVEKIRLSKLQQTPESIEKMRASLLGRKLSPETKEKIRLSKLGRKLSPAHVEKIRLSKLQQTPEVRYKNSQAHLIKGPQHPLSNVCDFRSPTNVVWHVSNIGHFVRTHKHLFDEIDTVPNKKYKSPRTKAGNGLRSLCRRVNPKGSWKGWTLVSDVARFKNSACIP